MHDRVAQDQAQLDAALDELRAQADMEMVKNPPNRAERRAAARRLRRAGRGQ